MTTMSCIEHTGSAFLQPMRNVAGTVGLRQMQRDDTARCKILRPVRQSCRLIAPPASHRSQDAFRAISISQQVATTSRSRQDVVPVDARG